MGRVRAALARVEAHWIGDLIAVLCLFAIPVTVMFAGLVFGGGQ